MIGKKFLKILKNVTIMNLITVKITHQEIDKWTKKQTKKTPKNGGKSIFKKSLVPQ